MPTPKFRRRDNATRHGRTVARCNPPGAGAPVPVAARFRRRRKRRRYSRSAWRLVHRGDRQYTGKVVSAPATRVSLEEFQANPDIHYYDFHELHDGEVVVVSPPTVEHMLLQQRIQDLLGS